MLTLGQDGSGSFALAENLQSLTDTVIDARLKEIKDQLNHDLVPQLFALNGFDTTVLPYFDYVDNKRTSLDDLSKYIQRIAAVGGIKFDADAVNFIHEQAGLPKAFDDTTIDIEEVRRNTSAYSSGAGEGMVKGTGNGTSDDASERDNSTSNLEN